MQTSKKNYKQTAFNQSQSYNLQNLRLGMKTIMEEKQNFLIILNPV